MVCSFKESFVEINPLTPSRLRGGMQGSSLFSTPFPFHKHVGDVQWFDSYQRSIMFNTLCDFWGWPLCWIYHYPFCSTSLMPWNQLCHRWRWLGIVLVFLSLNIVVLLDLLITRFINIRIALREHWTTLVASLWLLIQPIPTVQ